MFSRYMSDDIARKYKKVSQYELDDLEKYEDEDLERMILMLIAKYGTGKFVLAEQEYKLNELQLQYDDKFTNVKHQIIRDGFKSTEAKELAKQNLKPEQEEIMLIEKDIALLKVEIHSIEYQLRLKFLQAKRELLMEGKNGL